MLTSKKIQSRYIQGIIKRTEIEIVREYWLLDKQPSCKVHWIELAAKSDERVIPKTEGSSTNNDQFIPKIESEIINAGINRINTGINSPEPHLSGINTGTYSQSKVKESKNAHTGGGRDFLKYSDYIEKNCPRILKNFTNQLNFLQEDKLSAEFKETAIFKTLDQLENYRQINKFDNLYYTLLNWIPRTQSSIEKEEMQYGNNKQTNQYGSKSRKSKPNVDELNEMLKTNRATILADGAKCCGLNPNADFNA